MKPRGLPTIVALYGVRSIFGAPYNTRIFGAEQDVGSISAKIRARLPYITLQSPAGQQLQPEL